MIQIGFLGAGLVADIHASAIRQIQQANLLGIWDIDQENGANKAAQYDCTLFKTADKLLENPEIDAVFILTNMETHCEYALRAVHYGKHILIEKPVAASLNELRTIQKAVNQANVKCMPGHNYIYEPGVKRIHTMIQAGRLGTIAQFYMLYNIQHAEEIRARYPGVIRQILTHHSYTTLYLAGQPQSISCMISTINGTIAPQENLAMVNAKLTNGALGHLCASFANDDHAGDPWTCMIKVIGTKGSTRYSYRDWVIHEKNGPHAQTYFSYPESIKNTAIHFINRVIRKSEEPLSSLEDAITCQRMIEACERSAKEGIHVHFSK